MCVVSMVFDHGNQQPWGKWDKESVKKFEELVEAAKKYDEATGQPDCEDPKKMEFFKRVKRRVASREAAKSIGLTGTEADAFALGVEWADVNP